MAILDALAQLSAGQAETTIGAHDSTNILDLGAGVDEWGNAVVADYGEGKAAWLHVRVNEKWTSDGSATLAVAVHDSADNSSFAAVSPAINSGAIPVASLVAGYSIIRMPLPPGLREYVKVVYTIGTAAMTAGKVDAWIGPPTAS